jgi:hypothetical protein
MRHEGFNGTRNRDCKKQLRLGSERTSRGIYRKTFRTGYRKTNNRIFCQTSKNEGLDIAERSAPSETEKEIAHKVGAGNVGAPATVGSFVPTVGTGRKR